MQAEYERLAGVVRHVTFANPENGFTVLELIDSEGESVTVVGCLAMCAPGESLDMIGSYTEHREYGLQFKVERCKYLLPESIFEIEQYLASGVLPGIGPAIAKRIVGKFGLQALEMLASQPQKLAEIKGFTAPKAIVASKCFVEVFSLREAICFLESFGFTIEEGITIYRHYGEDTLSVIGKNPYCLCLWPLYVSFAQADAIAASFADALDTSLRTQAALLYTLRHNMQNGHTCLPKDKLLATTSVYFRIETDRLSEQLDVACEEGLAVAVNYAACEYIYLAEAYRAEFMAAQRVRDIAKISALQPQNLEKMIAEQESFARIEYAELQKKAIREALCKGAVIITGGPGTGKTTTVNAIIDLFERSAQRVLLAAPTGRAAKRLSELCGRKATTIHRMLEVDFMNLGEYPAFKRNAQNPLKCDVVIVDEMSMVDIFLFESLLNALRPGCRLVMVGDADQLPSVGPGNVLWGLIASGAVAVVALNEIFRQAAESLIVKNAHRIVQGELPVAGQKNDDYFFLKSFGLECQDLVCELVCNRLPASYSFSPVSDIQVLCPGHKGPLGTWELNKSLQKLLNPPAKNKPELKHFEQVLRTGDKVMQVKNNYDISYVDAKGNPGKGAYNGDIGIVESVNVKAGTITVICEDRHVEYTPENMHELELAYAVTIHKSQGSEFDAVVIAISEVPRQLQYRNLIYTAVTRAKKLCVIAGEQGVLAAMVNAGNKAKRYSCFADLLKDVSIE